MKNWACLIVDPYTRPTGKMYSEYLLFIKKNSPTKLSTNKSTILKLSTIVGKHIMSKV